MYERDRQTHRQTHGHSMTAKAVHDYPWIPLVVSGGVC